MKVTKRHYSSVINFYIEECHKNMPVKNNSGFPLSVAFRPCFGKLGRYRNTKNIAWVPADKNP